MKMNRKRNVIFLFCFLTAVLLFSGILSGIAAEDTAADPELAFEEKIAGLEEKGLIPAASGTYLSLGDYEDSLALMGYVRKVPLMEAENFVISVHMAWESANRTPNTQTAGCGIIFNSGNGSSDYVLASVRMDGAVYITGLKYYTQLSYGKFFYGLPSVEGSADFLMIVNNQKASVYVNDQLIATASNIPVMGNEIGLGILSGTYQDFGNRCKFGDIRIYTWVSDQE